jgi:predicted nucleotidyltransferase
MDIFKQLDPHIQEGLEAFKADLVKVFGDDLCAVYIIGSGAEARVRPLSDINLIVVLSQFPREKAQTARESYRMAKATVNLAAMFVLRDELQATVEAFPVKFVDAKMRHVLLCGEDLLKDIAVPRDRLLHATKQSILNTRIRLRERYLLVSLRKEQLVRVIADSASSLRAAAASLLYLEGRQASSPREALKQICAEAPDGKWTQLIEQISGIREQAQLGDADAEAIIFELLALTDLLGDRLSANQGDKV